MAALLYLDRLQLDAVDRDEIQKARENVSHTKLVFKSTQTFGSRSDRSLVIVRAENCGPYGRNKGIHPQRDSAIHVICRLKLDGDTLMM